MSAIFKLNKKTKVEASPIPSNSSRSFTPLLPNDEIAALSIQASQILHSSHTAHQQLSREAGWLPTKALGSGMDYAESREYQQGDDPRYINWRLSARSDETFVKTYHMEARPSLCIVLDQRQSMIFGTKKRLKITQALRLSTMLAHASQQHHIDLNLLLIDETKTHWLGKQNVDSLLEKFNHNPPQISTTRNTDSIKFQSITELLQQHLNIGSMIYLISDFFDFNALNIKTLSELYSQYFILGLHIVDAAEKKLPKSGGVCLKDIKTDENLTLDSNDPQIHSNINESFNNHFNVIKKALIQSEVAYSEIPADADVLYPFIELPLGS
ncbi:MAG: DUF58 domain-containing protein [Gammaproteobacteria bacterium]